MSLTDPSVSIEDRITALEKRVEFLEKERPGRRMKPNVVSQAGVCGIDPGQDSATCANASIYRYQQGCRGTACVTIHRDYYTEYRAKRRSDTVAGAPVEVDPSYSDQ